MEEIISNTGAILIYLPPYSPELNPIEGVFAIVKQWLRENQEVLLITDDIISVELSFKPSFKFRKKMFNLFMNTLVISKLESNMYII